MSSFSSPPPPPRVVLLWNISAAQRNWPLAHEENFYARVRDKGMLQYNSDVKKNLSVAAALHKKVFFGFPRFLKILFWFFILSSNFFRFFSLGWQLVLFACVCWLLFFSIRACVLGELLLRCCWCCFFSGCLKYFVFSKNKYCNNFFVFFSLICLTLFMWSIIDFFLWSVCGGFFWRMETSFFFGTSEKKFAVSKNMRQNQYKYFIILCIVYVEYVSSRLDTHMAAFAKHMICNNKHELILNIY